MPQSQHKRKAGMAPGSFERSQRQRPAPTTLIAPDAPPNTKRTPVANKPTPPTDSPSRRTNRAKRTSASSGTSPRSVGKAPTKAITTSRAFYSGRVQNPERVIALELILAEFVYIGVKLYEGQVPEPRVIATLLAVFAILGFVTIFGTQWGRVAYLFGALVVLAALFNKETEMVANKLVSKKAQSGTLA